MKKQMPTGIDSDGQAHRQLDAAVFAAYGWPPDLSDADILARLLELNLEITARTRVPRTDHGREQPFKQVRKEPRRKEQKKLFE